MLIALSLFFPFFLGLGCLVLHLHPAIFFSPLETKRDSARLLFLATTLGVLLNYALVLVIGGLQATLLVGAGLSIGGLLLTVRTLGKNRLRIFRLGWLSWTIIAYLALLFAAVILFLPLQDWDARSIWFFHGKMIFYNNQTMNAAAGWDQPFAEFSHIGYPKLVSILAAQFAACAGFWNEFFPKASLLVLLIPALLGIFSFLHRFCLTSIFLIAMWIFGLSGWLWNGYMDGYLALYSGLSVLFLAQWLQNEDPLDALAGIVSLAMTVSLKNEGILLVVSALTAIIVGSLAWRARPTKSWKSFPIRLWPVAGIAFLGFFIWHIMKNFWGLSSSMPSSLVNWSLYSDRLQEGAAALIANAFLIKAEVAMGLALVISAGAAGLFMQQRLPRTLWFILLTAGIYAAGLFLIYWTTQADLAWHLATSATRTMLPVLQLLFAATYTILQELEKSGEVEKRDPK